MDKDLISLATQLPLSDEKIKQLPKISIIDNCFGHSSALGCGDNNWPPRFFDYDDINPHEVCLITDGSMFFDITVHCPVKIGWLLEPYSVSPDYYHTVLDKTDKFDYVLTHNQALIDYNPEKFIYYPFGGCWINHEDRRLHDKTKLISIIASHKKQTYGHQLRHKVIERFGGSMDVVGRGYKEIAYKGDALNPYMFSVVIENDNNEYYFTEKLIDCLVTGTIPIYWGTDVSKFFNTDGFILFQNTDELQEKLKQVTPEFYQSKIEVIKENLEKAKQYVCPEDWIWKNFLKDIYVRTTNKTSNS